MRFESVAMTTGESASVCKMAYEHLRHTIGSVLSQVLSTETQAGAGMLWPGNVCRKLLPAHCVRHVQAEGIDADAARYLKAVREEASRIPHVCASQRRAPCQDAASPSTPHTAGAAPEPPKLAPPMTEWTYGVIQGFIDARSQVEFVVRPLRPLCIHHLRVRCHTRAAQATSTFKPNAPCRFDAY